MLVYNITFTHMSIPLTKNMYDAPPKFFDGLNCESKDENNRRRKSWGMSPGL
jgi:hypothetical protein